MMRIVVSSDEWTPLINVIIEEAKKRSHEVVYIGPTAREQSFDWTEVTLKAMEEIRRGIAQEGICLCWTGTGCTLIANKVKGIRAALCVDAETAKGARIWNYANVLGLSIRLTTSALLKEILSAWFDTPYSTDAWNLSQMKRIVDYEQ